MYNNLTLLNGIVLMYTRVVGVLGRRCGVDEKNVLETEATLKQVSTKISYHIQI